MTVSHASQACQHIPLTRTTRVTFTRLRIHGSVVSGKKGGQVVHFQHQFTELLPNRMFIRREVGDTVGGGCSR